MTRGNRGFRRGLRITGGLGAARRLLAAGVVVFLLTSCTEPAFPRDPDGTLTRASGGTLLVGVSQNPPFTRVTDEGMVSGDEAQIVGEYAESIGADIAWHEGPESELMELLKLGQLDMAIGGFTEDSPWTSHAAFTRPYAVGVGTDGTEQKMVIATRLGENALLTNLERFLADEGLQA